MIFALVEKRAGLLAAFQVIDEGHTVLLGKDLRWHFAIQNADGLLEALQQPHFGIVALQNSLGRKKFGQKLDDQCFLLLTALAQRLN